MEVILHKWWDCLFLVFICLALHIANVQASEISNCAPGSANTHYSYGGKNYNSIEPIQINWKIDDNKVAVFQTLINVTDYVGNAINLQLTPTHFDIVRSSSGRMHLSVVGGRVKRSDGTERWIWRLKYIRPSTSSPGKEVWEFQGVLPRDKDEPKKPTVYVDELFLYCSIAGKGGSKAQISEQEFRDLQKKYTVSLTTPTPASSATTGNNPPVDTTTDPAAKPKDAADTGGGTAIPSGEKGPTVEMQPVR